MPMPTGHGCRDRGWAESGVARSAPCPSIAAGSCGQPLDAFVWEQIMPGGRGGELLVADMVQWFGLVAFLCG